MAVVVENVLSTSTYILVSAKRLYLKESCIFQATTVVANYHSGDKQVYLLLWSWLKLCFQDECLNIIRLIQILNLYCHKCE